MRAPSYLLLLAASASLALTAAFPSGAPDSACKDMRPGHGVEPATSAAPFELTQDKQQAEAGDQIKATFKGLMVQASNDKGEPLGKFLAGKGLKTLDSCAAVTHSDREPKKTATLVWEAPGELKGKHTVHFRATVVQKFSEFHTDIKSTLAATR